MVSFWPFKGDSTSAASFEKTLSQLSTKINRASAQNDRLRHNKRHSKALLTLYGSFAYIIIALILILVTGFDKWGALEYSAVAGGPVLIYGVRTGLDAYYNYRIANSQSNLNGLYAQRESTIEKLKAATKYNSTQQLLDKYGGSPQQKPGQTPQQSKRGKQEGGKRKQDTSSQGRTGFAPPPTANIPNKPPSVVGQPGGTVGGEPPHLPLGPHGIPPPSRPTSSGNATEPSEDFAPNAFAAPVRPPNAIPPSSSQYAGADGPKWYDRIMDVVLGEDETSAKNRVALICQNCRLVNGQAPPGARTLEEIGRWRCSSCHAWNGVESEEKKILSQLARDGGAGLDSGLNSEVGSPVTAVHEEGDGNDDRTEHVQQDGGE